MNRSFFCIHFKTVRTNLVSGLHALILQRAAAQNDILMWRFSFRIRRRCWSTAVVPEEDFPLIVLVYSDL